MRLLSLLILSITMSAHDHGQPKFEGLVSSDVFSLDGGMNLYVEKGQHVMLAIHQNIFIQLLEHWFMF